MNALKSIFHLVLAVLPGAIGAAESTLETAITSGADKKTKAVDAGILALTVLNQVPPFVGNHPDFVKAVGAVNDALVNAANIAQQIHDAAQPIAGAGSSPSQPSLPGTN